MQKDYIRNHATCSCENSKCLESIIIYDSVIEIIDTTKSVSTKTVSAKNASINFHILLIFLLITIALLVFITISIYFCFKEYHAKQNIYYHIMKPAN